MNIPKLKGIMAEQGFTQKNLAKAIGVSEATMSAKLTGATSFNTNEALKICDVLHITDNKAKAEIFLT